MTIWKNRHLNFTAHVQSPCVLCLGVQGRSGLAGSQVGRSFPRRSFVRPSWMDEDTVDSADASVSLFFSKVSSCFIASNFNFFLLLQSFSLQSHVSF